MAWRMDPPVINQFKTDNCSARRSMLDDPTSPGDYSNPVYKQISIKNGQINKMAKEELRKKLQELHLDSRGVKEVLKKRLKNYYKSKKLMKAHIEPSPGSAVTNYDYLLVIDFEATCQEHNPSHFKYEIIEFPIVMVNTRDFSMGPEFHSYVRPVINPRLTAFCTSLTGITQEMVEKSDMFAEVLDKVHQWLKLHELGTTYSFAVVTDGPWDMSRFMHIQCQISNLPFPRWARRWINIRKTYSNFYGCRRGKLAVMLENLGMTFDGQQHSGIDDSRNIARIVIRLLQDGCQLKHNEGIRSRKLHRSDMSELEVTALEGDADVSDSDNGHANKDCMDESKSRSRDDVCEVSQLLADLNVSHTSENRMRTVSDSSQDNVDDLLAYYALQST